MILPQIKGREFVPGQLNGYSIAEILLVFGIIASVLIGVWAIYTMLGDEVDVRAVVAEIEMLRHAAVEYKRASKSNYSAIDIFPLEDLKPYLGESGLAKGVNIFGQEIDGFPWPLATGENFVVHYYGIPRIDICVNVLRHIGKVTDNGNGTYQVSSGDANAGYLGGLYTETGCSGGSPDEVYLYILID